MKVLLIIGDSQTQKSIVPNGWGNKLQEAYITKLDILFHGFSGYNTRWILEDTSIFTKSDISILFLGTNDCASLPSFQHVPLQEFELNYRRIIALLSNPILVTPANNYDPNRANVKAYVDVIRRIASELNLVLVDLYSVGFGSECFVDGLHFSLQGHELLFKEILKGLQASGYDFNLIKSYLKPWRERSGEKIE